MMKKALKELRKEKRWSRYFLRIFGLLLALFCLLLLVAKIMSYGAVELFNYAASRQEMLRGTITVESITANIHGGVTFEKLAWDDPAGNPILRVPSGSFKVDPWDVLRMHFVSTTIREITLESPAFAVHFDEEMHVDFINRRQGEIEQEKARDAKEKLEDRISNFNREGKPLDVTITVHNGRMAAFYRQRRYLVSRVSLNGHIDTRGVSDLHIKTGEFGGTMVGNGIEADCEIDFKEKNLPSIVSVTAKGVIPSSMGLGDDIHDKMTLTASGRGPLSHLICEGTVTMPELHVPALDFYDVKGDIHYDDGAMTFSDVKARVYGGIVTARGDYNVDSRVYNIYLHGEGLDSRIPTKEPRFYCLVTLDGEIHCDGNVKDLVAFGSFSSGGGFYSLIPFRGITGTFHNRYRALDFYDVTIDTDFGLIHTDAFHIIDGKLHLGKIELVDKENGESMSITDARNQKGPGRVISPIREDIKEIKERVSGLTP